MAKIANSLKLGKEKLLQIRDSHEQVVLRAKHLKCQACLWSCPDCNLDNCAVRLGCVRCWDVDDSHLQCAFFYAVLLVVYTKSDRENISGILENRLLEVCSWYSKRWAGEMAPWFRAPAALSEDLGSVPSTHTHTRHLLRTPAPPSSRLLRRLHVCGAIHTQTHTNK